MKLTKLSLAMVGCASMVAGVAHAGGPTLSDVLGNSGITESGFIDAAYTSTDALNSTNAFSGNNATTFDVRQAAIQLAKQPTEGFGGLLNITMGSDADMIKSSPYTAGTGASGGYDVTQAFVQYASGALTVMGGKFATLAGAEVIAPTGNTNITRSIAFFQLPYTHTGLRAAYAASGTVTLYGGVNNGWDQQQDTNKGKTGELGVAWNPSGMVGLTVQGYYGDENVTGFGPQTRTLVDAVLTIKPTDKLALILNVDSGSQKDALGANKDGSYSAYVGYINYQWTDKWRTSLRAEQFDDKDLYKVALGSKSYKEVTLTVGYAPDPSFELRGEIRSDKADKKSYTETDSAATPTDSSTTLALEGLYKF